MAFWQGLKWVQKTAVLWAPVLVLFAIAGTRWTEPKIFETVQVQMFRMYQQIRPAPSKPVPVHIVTIDGKSIRRVGQWPWPRNLLAKMTDQLIKFGAKAVVFDLVFSEADRTSPRRIINQLIIPDKARDLLGVLPDNDQVFAEALAKTKSVVGVRLPAFGRPLKMRGPATFTGQRESLTYLSAMPKGLGSIPVIMRAAKGVGNLRLPYILGAGVNRAPLAFNQNGQIIPLLAAEALRVAADVPGYVIKTKKPSWWRQGGVESIEIGDIKVPTDYAGRMWLYFGDPGSIKLTRAAKLLAGRGVKNDYDGRIVFIGLTASGKRGGRIEPLGRRLSHVEMQARMVEQILSANFLTRPDWSKILETLWILLLGGLALVLLRLGVKWAVLGTFGLFAGSVVITGYGFVSQGILLDPFSPGLSGFMVLGLAAFLKYAEAEHENRWIRLAFSSFVSPNLVEQLIEQPEALKLGGERRELSFIFTDLAGFTSLVEKSEPGTLIPILNAYLNEMIAIGFRHGGTLDAIVGDATTFFFNAPVKQSDHAERALNAALEMDQFACRFALEKAEQGYPLGETRIGIHTGPVIVGNMGGDVIFNYAAHGDAINTAARMEGVNKYLGTRVAVSIETASRCPDFHGRPIGSVVLKGKSAGILAFQPMTLGDMDTPMVKAYLMAYDLLTEEEAGTQEQGKAIVLFQKLAKEFPDDPLILFHCNRLKVGEKGTLIHMLEK